MTMYRAQVIDSQLLALSTYGTVTSQPIATFETDIIDSLVNLEVAITATGGGGTPVSPIAINGYSQAVVNACGKNLFDIESWLNANSITYTKTDDSITFIPNLNLYTNPYVFSDRDINVSASVTYFGYNGTNLRLEFLNKNNVSQTVIATGDLVKTNFNACKVRLNWSTMGTSVTVKKPMINLGSTATAYEPYNGTTETISFGQTVYGGRLNVGSGVLTVTHDIITLNGTDMQFSGVWGATGNGYAVYRTLYGVDRTKLKSDKFIYSGSLYQTMPLYTFGGSSGAISTITFILPDTVIDLTSANVWLQNNNIGLLYEKDTPITIQLDSKQIQTIIGTNNIYADTGDIIDLKFVLSVGKAIS